MFISLRHMMRRKLYQSSLAKVMLAPSSGQKLFAVIACDCRNAASPVSAMTATHTDTSPAGFGVFEPLSGNPLWLAGLVADISEVNYSAHYVGTLRNI
jgi:hypothetical protein